MAAPISPFLRDLLDFPGSDVMFALDVPGVGVPEFISPVDPFLCTGGPGTQQQPRLLTRGGRQGERGAREGRSRREVGWNPPCDVREDPGHICIELELPGMKKEDIELHFSGNVLEIRGKKPTKSVGVEKEERWIRRESASGEFKRVVPLPKGVDTGKIKARFSDGVLEIKVPKPEKEEEKIISIAIEKKKKKSEQEKKEKKVKKERKERKERKEKEKKEHEEKERAVPRGAVNIKKEVVQKIGEGGQKKRPGETEVLEGVESQRKVVE